MSVKRKNDKYLPKQEKAKLLSRKTMNSDINLLTFILVDKKYVNMLGNLWILQKAFR
jgi:hypothetical protein